MTSQVQVLGIGNAIVDVLTRVDDEFLAQIGAEKRSMTLINEQRAIEVYTRMGPAVEMSGGSVANTIAGLASLGDADSMPERSSSFSRNMARRLPESGGIGCASSFPRVRS